MVADMNAEERKTIEAIRARLEKFENASAAYEEHRARYPGFGSVARKLEQQMIQAYDNAILTHAPRDVRDLLGALDAAYARIAALEAQVALDTTPLAETPLATYPATLKLTHKGQGPSVLQGTEEDGTDEA